MHSRKLYGVRAVIPQTDPARCWTPAVPLAPVYGRSEHSNLLSPYNGITSLMECSLAGYHVDWNDMFWFLREFSRDAQGVVTSRKVSWLNTDFFNLLPQAYDPLTIGNPVYYRREYLIPVDHPVFCRLVSLGQLRMWDSATF